MPLVGFGTWQLHGTAASRAVRTALDVGYRLIDTATMYRNEKQVGQAISDSGIARDELFVTTKLPPGNAGRERRTIEASLRALGLDHVDLWLIHWPPAARALVPTWEGVLALRDAGLVTSAGVSNYSIDQIDRLVDATSEVPAVNQIPWAPSLFDAELLAASRERGVVVEGYSPFKNTDLDDRREPLGVHRPGCSALARAARGRRDPEVGRCRADRAELRRVRLRAVDRGDARAGRLRAMTRLPELQRVDRHHKPMGVPDDATGNR
jgi:diketogulonate reductase-like aldo/keto reductase